MAGEGVGAPAAGVHPLHAVTGCVDVDGDEIGVGSSGGLNINLLHVIQNRLNLSTGVVYTKLKQKLMTIQKTIPQSRG